MTQTTVPQRASLILNPDAIERKMLRMAYEIYERNAKEEEIILAGISDRGRAVARKLKDKIKDIATFRIHLIEIDIDKAHPLGATLKEDLNCSEKIVIVVDDVANSGRTLFYGMRPFMDMLPKEVETAVLVDRMHKNYPILVDYTGYQLSTTLQESVIVDISNDEIKGVYLD